MIEVQHISKSYGSVCAVQDISFEIGAGEIVAILGPNGAGKTTTIKMLTGYLQPDMGSIRINGLDVIDQPRAVQEHIGYLPETAPLYPELSVQAYLMMMADLRRIPVDEQRGKISEAVYATGLENHLARLIGELSKGFRQRVGLAQAILHMPKLLILDEPTIGLDPTQIVEIRGLIRRLAAHSTVLFSTHILSEVEALCDRAVILINGQIRADAHLAELSISHDAVLVVDKRVPGIKAGLSALTGVVDVDVATTNDGYPCYLVRGAERIRGGDLCPLIFDLACENDWPLRELQQETRTLEMVFNELATTQ